MLPAAANALEINELHVRPIKGGEHVSIRLSEKASYHLFMVEHPPPRLVLDLPPAHWRSGAGLPKHYNDPLIARIRYSRYNKSTTRVVFDFVTDVRVMNSKLERWHHAYWLVFDVMRGAGSSHAAAETTQPPEEEPKSKPVIILDAGHGGQDPGTAGYAGSREKDLTLQYARLLKAALLETGRYQVHLTRTDDRYLLLGERVRRARANHGNLFISIHANSSPVESADGLSVYTISETASDQQSEALAEKENKADIIGGMDLSGTSKDVADILIDLTQRETRSKSNQFADLLVKKLSGDDVNLLVHTHRFAGFAVLKAPDIPSVLVEVGFLTNPDEERLLHTKNYEHKITHGVVDAVNAYFSK